MSGLHRVRFTKGHGTKNDFVIIADPDAELELSAKQVARICDRRGGIGADGVLRVVPVEELPDQVGPRLSESSERAAWFMDYRNADGSTASMCGNGARVFARYLREVELVREDSFVIATRAGTHEVQLMPNGDVSVEMGLPSDPSVGPDPEVVLGDTAYRAQAWWVPNPHAVVFVDRFAQLPTELTPIDVNDHGHYPRGTNVEFVEDQSGNDLRAAMRVHERGVGETMSCGTGACAVSLALRSRHDVTDPGLTLIDVLGGRLVVSHTGSGRMDLIGPTELVANGSFESTWWGGNDG
ncbi:MAG: diaminopimelate epimerase [Actinobacteria bacterium]|nr:diaminopimelate epimerase [Actinomycetota bacterium]